MKNVITSSKRRWSSVIALLLLIAVPAISAAQLAASKSWKARIRPPQGSVSLVYLEVDPAQPDKWFGQYKSASSKTEGQAGNQPSQAQPTDSSIGGPQGQRSDPVPPGESPATTEGGLDTREVRVGKALLVIDEKNNRAALVYENTQRQRGEQTVDLSERDFRYTLTLNVKVYDKDGAQPNGVVTLHGSGDTEQNRQQGSGPIARANTSKGIAEFSFVKSPTPTPEFAGWSPDGSLVNEKGSPGEPFSKEIRLNLRNIGGTGRKVDEQSEKRSQGAFIFGVAIGGLLVFAGMRWGGPLAAKFKRKKAAGQHGGDSQSVAGTNSIFALNGQTLCIGENIIGLDPDVKFASAGVANATEIRISDAPGASQSHCKIRVTSHRGVQSAYLSDLGGNSIATKLNGVEVAEEVEIVEGDEIGIGFEIFTLAKSTF